MSAHPSVIGRQRNSRREDQSSGSQIADSAYVIGRIWHNLLKNQDGELDPPDFMQSERQLSTVCVRKLPFRLRPDPVTSDSRPSSPFPFLDAVPQTGRSLRKRTRAASRTAQTPHATTRGGHSSGASKRRQGASSGRYPSETVSLLRRPAQTGLHSDAGRWSPPVSSACAVARSASDGSTSRTTRGRSLFRLTPNLRTP